MGEEVQGRGIIGRHKIDGEEVKNSIGNRELKELICTTHGHELSGEMLKGGRVQGGGSERGQKNWDNCNSITSKTNKGK